MFENTTLLSSLEKGGVPLRVEDLNLAYRQASPLQKEYKGDKENNLYKLNDHHEKDRIKRKQIIVIRQKAID